MAAPIFNQTTNAQRWKQGRYQIFQPLVTGGEPDEYSVKQALPPGLRLNQATGRIDGAPTQSGNFVAEIRATNVDGTTTLVVVFAICPDPAAATNAFAIPVAISLGRRFASLGLQPAAEATTTDDEDSAEDEQRKLTPLCSVKTGDDVVFALRFFSADGNPMALRLSNLRFGLKEFETDRVLVASDEWGQRGGGSAAIYLVHAKFTGGALNAAASNYEEDFITGFLGPAEFEWTIDNSDLDAVGPAELVQTTASFGVLTVRELLREAA